MTIDPLFRGWDLATTESRQANAMMVRNPNGDTVIHWDWSLNGNFCRYCGMTAQALCEGVDRPCARPLWPLGVSVPPPAMRGLITEVRQ